jgi:hypothetical protein
MAARRKAKADVHVRKIREILETQYARDHSQAEIEVKRYNSVSVWVRIIDPDFRGTSKADRDDAVWKVLEMLPEETSSEVTLLFLFTPEEANGSIMNAEFERPTPSPI